MGGGPSLPKKANILKSTSRCPNISTPYFLLERERGFQNLKDWEPSENLLENV